MIWTLSTRADPHARAIADRHYTRQKPGTPQFVPPGRCLVLKATASIWVTSWPFAVYVKHAWAGAWVNSCFRREGGEMRASDMIREAVAATRWYWPETPALGLVTFVNGARVRRKRDPGRCYLRAGFTRVGTTAGGLIVLQLRPAWSLGRGSAQRWSEDGREGVASMSATRGLALTLQLISTGGLGDE